MFRFLIREIEWTKPNQTNPNNNHQTYGFADAKRVNIS